jgi:hypothetical protein
MAFRASKLMAPLALVVACHGSNNTTPRDAAENARDALLPEPDIGVARDAAEDARGALLPQAEAGSESTHTDAAADGRDQEEG